MNATRSRTGELIAAAGGVVLLISLFLPWRGVSDRDVEAAQGLGVDIDLPTLNAWESFTFLDIALLVPVVAALGLAALAFTSQGQTPRVAAAVTGLIGALAALAILYRIVRPLQDDSLEYGIYVGLVSSLVIVAGAALAMRAEGERAVAPSGG